MGFWTSEAPFRRSHLELSANLTVQRSGVRDAPPFGRQVTVVLLLLEQSRIFDRYLD